LKIRFRLVLIAEADFIANPLSMRRFRIRPTMNKMADKRLQFFLSAIHDELSSYQVLRKLYV
jgi:hypothetical protein